MSFESCPFCLTHNTTSETWIVRFGQFKRKSDQTTHQRYQCKKCSKTFSLAQFHPCRYQKKRQLNSRIYENIVSGVSLRRLALLLRVNRKTVTRKFIFLGLQAYDYFKLDRLNYPPSEVIEFDDLETFEHTKLKPLSVTMAVESGSRRILGFSVARMPAKGLLVQKSLKKYGPRDDERKIQRGILFAQIKEHLHSSCIIKSDQNPHYTNYVKSFFPKSEHICFKGRRGCVVGQGELKATGRDPLFSLNHSFAMLRANINRLFRRTWNTTKKPERLALHIAMYCLFHNKVLIYNLAK